MPLFIGIPGFLLNIKKISIRKPFELIKKYWNRLVLPWIVAVILYFIVLNINNMSISSIIQLIKYFIYPYYHLWYIPGFLSYLLIILLLWEIFKNKKHPMIYILTISAIISCISKFNILSYIFQNTVFNKLISIINYDFRLYNIIFFALGICLRNLNESSERYKKIVILSRIITSLSFLIIIGLFFLKHEMIEKVLFYIFNITLLITMIDFFTHYNIPKINIIQFIGKYSLPIYLYHVLCKIYAEYIFDTRGILYYTFAITLFSLYCIFVYFTKKIQFINTYIYGSTNSSLKHYK